MRTEDTAHEPARAPLAAAKQDHRRALGSLGEDLAAAHLLRRGFRVLERNVRTRHGEIDMIAYDERVLAFVEVKTLRARPGAAEPQPLAGLGWAQRKRLRRLAGAWLAREQARPRVQTLRFDAIGIVLDERGRLLRLDHLEGAW